MSDKQSIILDAAELAFTSAGYQESSVRGIAGLAGVNVAMLNYYFISKEKLLLAVLERKISYFKTVDEMHQAHHTTALQKLTATVRLNIKLICQNTAFYKFILREQLLQSSPIAARIIRDYIEERLNNIYNIITLGVERGELKELDVEMTCIAISGMFINSLLNPHFLSLKTPDADFYQRLEDYLIQGLYDLGAN